MYAATIESDLDTEKAFEYIAGAPQGQKDNPCLLYTSIEQNYFSDVVYCLFKCRVVYISSCSLSMHILSLIHI